MATNNVVILNFLDLSPQIVGFSHEYLESQCATALAYRAARAAVLTHRRRLFFSYVRLSI
jgi:hypothetical protein